MRNATFRSFAMILFALLALAAVGCADPADPAGETPEPTAGEPNPQEPEAGEPEAGEPEAGEPAPGEPEPAPEEPDPAPAEPEPAPAEPEPAPGEPEPGPDPGECSNDFFTGQVFDREEPDPLSPDGGQASLDPYEDGYDAGLGDVLDAIPESSEEGMNTADVVLNVTEATVVATYFNTENQPVPRANRQFWIADGSGSIQVFMFAGEEGDEVRAQHPPFNIKTGQKVSFTTTQVNNFNGVPQISAIQPDSWSLDSEDNLVYIRDINAEGGELGIEDVNTVVRVTGTLSGGEGCGDPSICYDFDYGADNVVTLRSSSQFIVAGDCVTYVGPVSAFNGTVQLNVANFGWLWSNDNE